MQGVVPHPEIAPLLRAGFVALAADCDDPEDDVVELAGRLEDAYMLPFVIFTDEEGSFLCGFSGAVDARRFKAQLEALSGP